jgi:competence protein ComEC
VLDVGQGDAILVQDGAHALLVDAGPDESVVQALARCHVMHLDAVLVTHLHDDHYGGLASLVGRMAVDSVLVARGVASNLPADMAEATRRLCAEAAEEVSYGDVIEVGGFDLRVASPTDAVDGSLNAHSVELVASYEEGGRRLLALLTGDAEQEQMEGLISREDVGDIDFLKVGHHGSEVSVTPAQAKRLRCEVAVASAGEGNEYGHPRRECVRTLEESGSVFLCTKDVGDVEVLPGERGPRVVCQRGGSPDAERPSVSSPRYSLLFFSRAVASMTAYASLR